LERKPISSDATFEVLIQRTPETFYFRGKTLPKLQADKPSVTLLKEEEVIRPFHETFEKIQRRSFQDQELSNAMAFQAVTKEQIDSIKSGGIGALWQQEYALSAKMFLLKEQFSDLYQVSVGAFKQVFGTLIDCDVQWSDKIRLPVSFPPLPVFVVKEKGVKGWVPLHELSSGMQKVLLIISDIVSLPNGSIYLIDEYENSLGVNAIDFLPQFLLDHGESLQFLITTHHPYLINSMPIKSWRVFHRIGSNVAIKHGADLEQKYGKSKQQAFIQLMNDPFYAGTG
jgi:hypothetical protein